MKYLPLICLLLVAGCQQDDVRPNRSNPKIEWDRTPVYKVGDSVDFEIRANSGGPGYLAHDWQVVSGALPPGITIDYQGTSIHLVGSPTTVGTYTIGLQLRVGDKDKRVTNRDLSFIVPSTTGPLTIYTPDFPVSYGQPVGSMFPGYYAYQSEIVATGGTNAGYTWAVVAGTAPTGMTIGAWPTGGLVMVSNPIVGTYDFTLEVTDSGGNTDTQDLQIVFIASPPLKPGSGVATGHGP